MLPAEVGGTSAPPPLGVSRLAPSAPRALDASGPPASPWLLLWVSINKSLETLQCSEDWDADPVPSFSPPCFVLSPLGPAHLLNVEAPRGDSVLFPVLLCFLPLPTAPSAGCAAARSLLPYVGRGALCAPMVPHQYGSSVDQPEPGTAPLGTKGPLGVGTPAFTIARQRLRRGERWVLGPAEASAAGLGREAGFVRFLRATSAAQVGFGGCFLCVRGFGFGLTAETLPRVQRRSQPSAEHGRMSPSGPRGGGGWARDSMLFRSVTWRLCLEQKGLFTGIVCTQMHLSPGDS